MDDLVNRLRAHERHMRSDGWTATAGTYGEAADRLEAQAAQIADLRAQLSRMIDPRALLKWEGRNLFLYRFMVGYVRQAVDGKWSAFAPNFVVGARDTIMEVRPIVERAVLKALGVSDEPDTASPLNPGQE